MKHADELTSGSCSWTGWLETQQRLVAQLREVAYVAEQMHDEGHGTSNGGAAR